MEMLVLILILILMLLLLLLLSLLLLFQVLTALRIIMGEDGTDIGAKKLKALRDNSNFVRRCVSCLTLVFVSC